MKKIDLKSLLTDGPITVKELDGTRYPENELGYFRMYYKGNWWGTAFPIHPDLNTPDRLNEFDNVIRAFRESFKDLDALKKWCRDKGFELHDWCGYDRWTLHAELEHALYRFDIRTMPGDYNVYLHCYVKEG